ncbi:hypothetical protein [Caviibacterium pharyngocola]|nr:hypothetical protein [Caviibacterium pharyngocola]
MKNEWRLAKCGAFLRRFFNEFYYRTFSAFHFIINFIHRKRENYEIA